jgi:maleylpyruvate isomerase
VILYGYWRSSCSWRVRIALTFKALDYEARPVHLTRDGGEQLADAHRQRNPLGQVPVLALADGRTLSQSMAILAYLEEQHPTPPLLPEDLWERACVRQVAEMINAGVQPLQNLAVLRHLKATGEVDVASWARHFISVGLDAVEAVAAELSGPFCVGDGPSHADLCLIPQLYNARRFECDLSRWPRLLEAEAAAMALPAFHHTHPDRQPGAPRAS